LSIYAESLTKVSTSSSSQNLIGLPSDPDSFASSLAHVVTVVDGVDEILGQAWIAAPNTMVTCGHVVEAFKRTPASITIKFPSSGNRYVVRAIKTHPSFGQAKDQLVRFDLATLQMDLRAPDSHAGPLPIIYDVQVPAQQNLSAIRYPGHLGQFTTSQFPLAQVGRYLGRLKKDDRFHLLHDLALAPGDSGSPLFDRNSVVAIHCGDTATLPGLNLPTTSIRLAISIDALRALGLSETVSTQSTGLFFAIGPGLLSFLLVSLVAFICSALVLVYPKVETYRLSQSDIQPVEVKFNEPLNGYYLGERVEITLTPRSNCNLYAYYVEDDRALILYPPPKSSVDAATKAGRFRVIDGYGRNTIHADNKGELHILALKINKSPVEEDELAKVDRDECLLPIGASTLIGRIEAMKEANPYLVLYQKLDAPRATKEKPNGIEETTKKSGQDQDAQSPVNNTDNQVESEGGQPQQSGAEPEGPEVDKVENGASQPTQKEEIDVQSDENAGEQL
ncbi:MAG: serine protease, partial [Candidatus Obscuribacterales bacterium]|nr:serine protease [Candidatus Obscuribacterales bacterium]